MGEPRRLQRVDPGPRRLGGFAVHALFAEQKAHIMGISADQLAVTVARVTEGFAGTSQNLAALIPNDRIAVSDV